MTNKPISTSDLKKAFAEIERHDLRVSKIEMNKADFDDIMAWEDPCKLCGMKGVQHNDPKECEIASVIDV